MCAALKNISPQNYFPFPSPINKYILDESNPQTMSKLYITCKYFYSKKRLVVVENFKCISTVAEMVINNRSYTFRSNKMEFVLKNVRLWLTDTLHYPSKICFPQFLSKIIKCDVQRLWLRSITGISLKEYKILAQNVSKLTICPRIISDKSIGPLFSLEDIVSSTPNADEIE